MSTRQIIEFQDSLSTIAPGTPEYYELSTKTVGGSQLKDLMRTCYDGLVRKVVAMRRGPMVRRCNKYWGWGIAFEQVALECLKRHLCTVVYCNNRCIWPVAGIPNFRYTPDGIALVHFRADGTLWTRGMRYAERAEAACVLVEIKCPTRRVPDGIIPDDYIPQVQGGLVATERLTQCAIFVDAMFRLCTNGQLGETSGYNTAFHDNDPLYMHEKMPIAWGTLKVYRLVDDGGTQHTRPVDYGAQDNSAIDEMLRRISARELIASLDTISFTDGWRLRYPLSSSLTCIGEIPFKFIKMYFVKQKPTLGYRELLKTRLEGFFRVVDDIQPL